MAAYVTDTHPLVWYAAGRRSKLSRTALRLFRAADEDRGRIYVPAVVLWEVGLLAQAGRVAPLRLGAWMQELLAKPGFELAPLDPVVIDQAVALRFADDPFDAAIVATALTRHLPLVTKDERIAGSRLVKIAW